MHQIYFYKKAKNLKGLNFNNCNDARLPRYKLFQTQKQTECTEKLKVYAENLDHFFYLLFIYLVI